MRRTRVGQLVVALALMSGAACPGTSLASSPTSAASLHARVVHAHVFRLAGRPTHIALHWRGQRGTHVRMALGRHGKARAVALDELSEERPGSETYGALLRTRGARVVRVFTDRPLRRLTVLALTDRGGRPARPIRAASSAQPTVLRRADWGADEALRYGASGTEVWPPAYYPVQKLIVHHTATQNADPDPAATIRSIYYYHAVTQGWGDIGYNFLIDEAGRVYEGRRTIDYPAGTSPTEEDSRGYGATGAHAYGYNSGSVGIALLGTLTSQDASPAARSALERLLAWEADRHMIDPQGAALYTNPVNGSQATFANIAGHRDVGSTECPGGVFYATLPTIRGDVAAMLAGSPPAPAAPSATTTAVTSITRASATLNGTVNPNGADMTAWFEYGRSSSYGSSTTPSSAGSGSSPVAVSTGIGGLARNTVYHVRVVAKSAAGTSYGADRTFRTTK